MNVTLRVLAVTCALVLLGCSAANTAPGVTPPVPIPQTIITEDGAYTVGRDVEAGTYTTAGAREPVPPPPCRWTVTDAHGVVITDRETTQRGDVATINPGETFTTNGCKPWIRA